MKLLTKRAKAILSSSKKVEKKETKSKSKKEYGGNKEFNSISDEYKDLITPVELPLDENGKIVISVKRGGEFGLPKVDIRFYATTNVYTGFTKKGINLNLDKLDELSALLLEVEDECEKEGLLEEFNEEGEETEE